jgi:hypothetical protein
MKICDIAVQQATLVSLVQPTNDNLNAINKLLRFSPQANYVDRATAACR